MSGTRRGTAKSLKSVDARVLIVENVITNSVNGVSTDQILTAANAITNTTVNGTFDNLIVTTQFTDNGTFNAGTGTFGSDLFVDHILTTGGLICNGIAIFNTDTTISGSVTLSSDISANTLHLKALTNQLTLGNVNAITINAPAPAVSVTYTIPDTGTASKFALANNTATNNFALVATSSNGIASWQAIVNSIAGTANEITASAATGTVTLSIPVAFTVPGSLTVTGLATMNSDLTVNGALSAKKGTFTSDLTVSGTFSAKKATFTSDIAAQGALAVTGLATMNSDLTVNGALNAKKGTFSSDLSCKILNATTGNFSSDINGNTVVANGGTASLPSFTFTGDTTTGIWNPSASEIAISAGGQETIRVNNSNVSIGHSSSDNATFYPTSYFYGLVGIPNIQVNNGGIQHVCFNPAVPQITLAVAGGAQGVLNGAGLTTGQHVGKIQFMANTTNVAPYFTSIASIIAYYNPVSGRNMSFDVWDGVADYPVMQIANNSQLTLNTGTAAAPSLCIGSTINTYDTGLFYNSGVGVTVNGNLGFTFTNPFGTLGQIIAANGGTAVVPAYTFDNGGSNNTGMYSSGTNTLNFSTGGVDGLKIDSNQGITLNSTPANATVGSITLGGGTAIVLTSAIKTNSFVFVTVNIPGGTQGFLSVPASSYIVGVSFIITSTSVTETSNVNWVILN